MPSYILIALVKGLIQVFIFFISSFIWDTACVDDKGEIWCQAQKNLLGCGGDEAKENCKKTCERCMYLFNNHF